MHQIQVAVPVPLRQTFDYLHAEPILPGTRVIVPFGKRSLVGVTVQGQPSHKSIKLKKITQVLDQSPLFSALMLSLLDWSARYYHHPLGEVFHSALPARLRKPNSLENPNEEKTYQRIDQSSDLEISKMLNRAPKQRMLYNWISENTGTTLQQIRELTDDFENSSLTSLMNSLVEKKLVQVNKQPQFVNPIPVHPFEGTLNDEQTAAVSTITQALGGFSSFVLHGITGSGKTEVYLHVAEKCLAQGKQVLVLVPEISLTPQLVDRFKQRLGSAVVTMHSSMTDANRYQSWWRTRTGEAKIVLGTRSAIFAPLENPGLIIVDEEHDLSFKQYDSFRYHARDLAIKRASLESIPVVLGSATPSMETMNNALINKHVLLELKHRAGSAKLPKISLVDIKKHPHQDGLSPQLLEAIKLQLKHNKQTILYINRRGFAPIAQCGGCGWQAKCSRCDAFMTVHDRSGEFRCHHCGNRHKEIAECPICQQALFYAGVGTQRVEQALKAKFPEARLLRFDRDEIDSHEKLETALDSINNGEIDIVIGTQLISKGHDFPRVTLVGVINPDQGLYSADFRASEYLVQQITQVSGRAGRSVDPGTVMIQTSHPNNPYLQLIHDHRYSDFYSLCSNDRKIVQLPPFGYIAMWRAESTHAQAALRFLSWVKLTGENIKERHVIQEVQIMDPISSPMEKLAGKYRAQLLIKSPKRHALHTLIDYWLSEVVNSKQSRQARWSLDIDPMEMF